MNSKPFVEGILRQVFSMKAVIVNVFASFLFISMSFKAHAEDQSQAVFPNLNPSDVQQQPVDQLSRMKRNSPGLAVRNYRSIPIRQIVERQKQIGQQKRGQTLENPWREQALAKQQQLQENKEKEVPREQPKKPYNIGQAVAKVPEKTKIEYKANALGFIGYLKHRRKEASLVKEIKVLHAKKPTSILTIARLSQLRAELKGLRTQLVEHRKYLLGKFYGKYFSEDDDQIELKLPEKLHRNCMLQAMVDPSFSPSCKPDRTYSEKQCKQKRCWCSTKRGEMLSRFRKGFAGTNGDGFYYGIKGITLRCPRN